MKKLTKTIPPLTETSHIRCQFCGGKLQKVRKPKLLFEFRIPFTLVDLSAMRHTLRFSYYCRECRYYRPVR